MNNSDLYEHWWQERSSSRPGCIGEGAPGVVQPVKQTEGQQQADHYPSSGMGKRGSENRCVQGVYENIKHLCAGKTGM